MDEYDPIVYIQHVPLLMDALVGSISLLLWAEQQWKNTCKRLCGESGIVGCMVVSPMWIGYSPKTCLLRLLRDLPHWWTQSISLERLVPKMLTNTAIWKMAGDMAQLVQAQGPGCESPAAVLKIPWQHVSGLSVLKREDPWDLQASQSSQSENSRFNETA